MAPKSDPEEVRGYVEELDSPQSPGADYGLKNDDGFDPAKYDFYNPTSRNVQEGQRSETSAPYELDIPTYTDVHDISTPTRLSPIEELDDDILLRAEHKSDAGITISVHGGLPRTMDSSDTLWEQEDTRSLSLEKRLDLLFSRQHLRYILADRELSLKFTTFLRTYRPDSVPILAYYLDACKALKTIKYAESVIQGLEPIPGHAFTSEANSATMVWVVEDKIDRSLDVLVQDHMPAFIAYVYVKSVDQALVDRVTGKKLSGSRGVAEGLAEVFVLSDPARPDNPIVFSSEEFHRMTGYSRAEFLGRNCRILGNNPFGFSRTSQSGINRFRASLDAEREHCEVLLNYHRDGSQFINLVMCVPLRDQFGKVRYYLGAQLDITDLVNSYTELSSFRKVIEQQERHSQNEAYADADMKSSLRDEFVELSESFDAQELNNISMTKPRPQTESGGAVEDAKFAEALQRDMPLRSHPVHHDDDPYLREQGSGAPLGFYQNYLLVRPHPSLRILFASPDLRTPGILQSPLMSRIGGSSKVREDLAHALEVGRKVTAKVQWISKPRAKHQSRWIHCTPLLGANDSVGVWMVILVEADRESGVDREHDTHAVRNENRLGGNYTADALPWDAARQKNNSFGVSTSIWSGEDDVKPVIDEQVKQNSRQSQSAQAKQDVDLTPPRMIRAGSGPRIAGVDYSFSSTGDRGGTRLDDGILLGGIDSRPSSHGSTIVPIRSQMQPAVKIAGRPSMDGSNPKKLPINMPGQQNVEGSIPTRRTYKSLSPYGILFED